MPGGLLAEQERDAIELFGRADRVVPDTNSVRKHALSHAIKLAHSHHTSLRRMAASNIAKFFKAFPDLEEDAINAVYDLCEDQDPNIRIEGYKAIVRMSEEQPRWLERNVDVLVQLLQSDEPEEVAVVKMALIQHLELDSKVTLGVLCDQIVPPDDPMEDEDKTIRERLRALVVAFLAQDARSPLLAQLQGQGRGAAEQEDALIDTLIKAVSKSPAADAAKIIEDILVFLPSFNDGRPTRRGNELVLLLLARAASALREDLAPGRNPASLEQSRVYLELSDLLCRAKSAADPVQLLRFYCTSSLMGKMTLGRLSQDSRAFFVARLAGALAACSHQKSPESSELASMRRQVVDALSVILPQFFIQVAPSDAQAWGSCEILLQTCQQVGGP
ncbi:apoptosis inhibitory protein 5-domain-containing protein [Lactarius vividus]|nr:apoptosis inhibitory protein 5-domain-containing protein [Lactarius vividus]